MWTRHYTHSLEPRRTTCIQFWKTAPWLSGVPHDTKAVDLLSRVRHPASNLTNSALSLMLSVAWSGKVFLMGCTNCPVSNSPSGVWEFLVESCGDATEVPEAALYSLSVNGYGCPQVFSSLELHMVISWVNRVVNPPFILQRRWWLVSSPKFYSPPDMAWATLCFQPSSRAWLVVATYP